MASESSDHSDQSVHRKSDDIKWSSFYIQSLWNLTSKLKLEDFPHELKVLMCYENTDIRNRLTKFLRAYLSLNQPGSKCSKKSSELRSIGNECFIRGDDEISLQKYNKSVIHAPYRSPELSLALGNRSAVLYRLNRFKECIADIDLAMKNCQLDAISSKLLNRRNAAQAQLQTNKAKCVETRKSKNEVSNYDAPFSVSNGPNASIPYASSLVELSGSTFNRRVIASDDIKCGDVLCVEKPFSFVTQASFLEEYCQYCCQLLKNPIACSQCTEYLFCNENCFSLAFQSFHKWECRGRLLLESIGAAHLAFNTVMIANQRSSPSNSFFQNQITHIDDIPACDLELYVATATLLIIYLELFTDFFNQETREKSIEKLGFDFLKQTLAIICNAFNLSRTTDSKNGFENLDLSREAFAIGVYPTAALINHSCEPNVNIIFLNDELIIRADRDIHKGEEIFHCYDPRFVMMEREERQEILRKQYHFDCKCTRCVQEEIDGYNCPKCKKMISLKGIRKATIKCQHCSQRIDVPAVRYSRFTGSIQDEDFRLDYRTRWESYSKRIQALRQQFGPYSFFLAIFMKTMIDSCLLDAKENCVDTRSLEIILSYFEEFLRIVEFNYGRCSVEYTISFEKKLDIMKLIESSNA